MASILTVDDNPTQLEMCKLILEPLGHELQFSSDPQQALQLFREGSFDVVLSDITMVPIDGITFLKEVKAIKPEAIVILMTATATMETAVQALRLGAFDYLKKPIKLAEFSAAIKRGLESRDTETGVAVEAVATASGGGSKARSAKVKQAVEKLAGTKDHVLIKGPLDEVLSVAQMLHDKSAGNGELLELDCKQRAAQEMWDLLIGDEGKGGEYLKSETAKTLLVSNVDHLPLDVQNSLDVVLWLTTPKVRIVSTTETDLKEKVDEGDFYSNLYSQIAQATITV